MKQIMILAAMLFGQLSFSQDYANDDNYFLIVLDGEDAYINKNTGEVVKPGVVQKKQTPTVLNSTVKTTFSSSSSHTVAKGDTFYGIAKKYNVNLNQLLAANRMSKNSVLSIGQVLNIPTKAEEATANYHASGYTVLKGDTLYSIARKYGKTVAWIKEANGLISTNIRPGQILKVN